MGRKITGGDRFLVRHTNGLVDAHGLVLEMCFVSGGTYNKSPSSAFNTIANLV